MADNKYWFKRRRYGAGWVPHTWQGAAVIVIFAAILLLGSRFLIDESDPNNSKNAIRYFILTGAATIALLLVTKRKAPSLRWRWGSKPDDNPDEDW